jgi:hypothetical protein
MRKANSYNPTLNNNYTQPEDQDQFRSLPINYRK